MKMKAVLGISCVILMCVSVLAIAADDAAKATTTDEAKTTVDRPQRPGLQRGPALERRGEGAVNREEMYKEAMARRTEVHKKEISKLEAILKLAEKEKATETAAAIKALIAEKDKEFKDQADQAEQRRAEMQKRMQERVSEQRQSARDAAEAATEDTAKKAAQHKKAD